MYELNPYDDLDEDDEGMVLIEEKPRKRRKRKNPEPAFVASPILLVAIGYLAWCGYNYSRSKVWSFTPWKLAKRPRLQLRQNNAQAEEERRRASFHRAVEESMKPTVFTVDTDIPWRKPTIKPSDEETVSFIYP